MSLRLVGTARDRFREDLLAHRNSIHLKDADYVEQTLGTSLNTYKKCVGPSPSLSLNRGTLISICSNAGLDPGAYGLNVSLPGAGGHYGGYSKADYGFIEGRYFYYRRSFLTGLNVTRSLLTISWDDAKSALGFSEQIRYVSDAGIAQTTQYRGEIYMHADRVLMSLLSIDEGEVRLTLLHVPERPTNKTAGRQIRTKGVLVTHGYPRTFFQPVVSAVTLEQVPDGRARAGDINGKTIKPGDPDYERIFGDLVQAEEHAVVMTALLARNPRSFAANT